MLKVVRFGLTSWNTWKPSQGYVGQITHGLCTQTQTHRIIIIEQVLYLKSFTHLVEVVPQKSPQCLNLRE